MNEDDMFRSWKTRGAGDDFAERVLARQQPRRQPRLLWVAAVLVLCLSALVAQLLPRGETQGAHVADARATRAIGDRATVVAEAHTKLSWSVQPSGAAVVQQDSGAAFYRVQEGEAFTVNTPFGSVDVRGTCFSVEVQEMAAIKTIATTAALSAAITGAVFVTVYEGRVALGSDNTSAKVEIVAGERAYATPGQAPKLVQQASKQAPTVSEADEPEALRVAKAEIATLQRELETVRREIVVLKATGAAASPSAAEAAAARHQANFRPSPEELQQMAKKCEIRVDMPGNPFNREPPRVGARWREGYGLSGDDEKAVQRALNSMHADVLKNVRELYILVTGDSEAAKWLSPQAMFQELEDKTAQDLQAVSRQRISAERAGLQPPPTDLSAVPPGERFLRWFADLPDAFEQRLAKEVGPERARAMHDKFQGWSGSRWTMDGCPEHP